MKTTIFSLFLVLCSLPCLAQTTLTIDPQERGPIIGDMHYGIFFEEINHAGDGGLYAELIRNRSFEDSDTPEYWDVKDGAEMSLATTNLMNEAQQQYLHIEMPKGSSIINAGFWGMNVVSGKSYKLSLWVRSEQETTQSFTASLCSADGAVMGSTTFSATIGSEWTKVTTEITATESEPNAMFSLLSNESASIDIDVVSLFPPTFKGRENGCREDLAQMLADMKPAFMRFPGGCYIEGEYKYGSQNRFEWKKTIGGIETRPGHRNINWNYRVSDGLGFHEMLQLSEDLGAAPLFVVNIGLGHKWCQPYNEIDEYIEEALDALEYANGDVTTKYGAMRASNGHPEPFNLKLIEIGNENYNYTITDNRDQSDHYPDRYRAFYDAIKEKYPDVMCIGNVQSWSTDDPTWRNDHPVDAVDEHYYRNPSWFVRMYNKYDSYDRATRPKVYAGEYAVTSNYGSTGNLAAALGEAVYMQGMENNSDICVMGSYAPIFVNENDQCWMPDMIRFNSSYSYGTPSYYVQKLMPNYVGKQNVLWKEENNLLEESVDKYCGLSSWLSSVKYSNLVVRDASGNIITSAPFDNTEQWQNYGGEWSEDNGELVQASQSMEGKLYLDNNHSLGDSYSIEVDAVKTGGKEGFLIAFNVADTQNYCWWNLGGWSNSKYAVEVCTNGSKVTVASAGGYIENDRTYHIRIVVNGGSVKCYLDENLVHSFSLPQSRKVYVSASIDDDAKKMYVKLVNPNSEASTTLLKLKGYHTSGCKLVQMTSASDRDENTATNQYKVVPEELVFSAIGSNMSINVPAYSFNILVMDIEEGEKNAGCVAVESGTYYLYDEQADAFLSRGSDWGTRATIDRIGVPIVVANDEDGYYTLRYADYSNSYLGKDVYPYTDKSTSYPIRWSMQTGSNGSVVLYNVDAEEYFVANGVESGATFSSNKEDATSFCLVTLSDYKGKIAKRDSLQNAMYDAIATDITSALLADDVLPSVSAGWEEMWSSGSASTSYGIREAYMKYGAVSNTFTGLAQGTYRITIPAFYRQGVNTYLAGLYEEGIDICNAYIKANDATKALVSWASQRTSDNAPDNMASAADCFAQGLYTNVIYANVKADGNLTISIGTPQYINRGWLIWGEIKIEKLGAIQDVTDYIVNPSFEEGFYGWTNYGMQTQNNSESSAAKAGAYYCESWTNAPGYLADYSVSQTLENLPSGKYRLTASCHAENQKMQNEISGVYLFAGDNKTSVQTTMDYVVYGVVGADGNLNIGFKCEQTNANWITVDNFRLSYLGEETESYQMSLDIAIGKLEDLLQTKKILTEKMRNDADELIKQARKVSDNDAILEAIDEINQMYDDYRLFRLDVTYQDGCDAYLFAYFPSNSDENLYYAISTDGFNFTPLNDGQRVMASDTVAIKKGIRDPHILRGEDGKTFYMVATDMRCAEGWASNRGIVMYRSNDLIHWQHSTVHFPERFSNGWSSVTRVWAPETIWDPDYVNTDGTKGRYMVYFSLLTNDDGTCTYDKVYYCYANDDFTDFITEPVFLFDRGASTIDADIVFDPADSLYHMIYKNENSGGISQTTAERLTAAPGMEPGSQWNKSTGPVQQTKVAVEGGGIYRLIDSNEWIVMYDCYSSGYYQFCSTFDWNTFELKAQTQTSGAFTPRHGTVLQLRPEETKALLNAFPSPSSISELHLPTDKTEKYYSIDGRPLSIPASGLTIVRNQTGTKKVFK